MAPATSLARLRKQVLDLVMGGRLAVTEACRSLGISRSRFYELRARDLTYGEAGLLPKPRPAERPDRRLAAPLVDQIIAYAIHHPTVGPRTIAAALALPRFGAWSVSHGGVSNVLCRAGLSRVPARLAAAEALSAAEGGPITERALRELRAQDVQHRHIGSDVPGEQLFLDTMFVGRLKGVGKIWQYSATDGACSFGFACVRQGEKSARAAAEFLEHHRTGLRRGRDRASGGGGRRWARVQGRVRPVLPAARGLSPPAAAPLAGPERLRRALPGDGSAPSLPHGLSLPLLHLGG